MVKGFGRMTLNFKYPFSVVGTTAGASIQCGDDPAYVWEHGLERYSKPWELAPDMVAELEGLEVIGGVDAFGRRVPIKRLFRLSVVMISARIFLSMSIWLQLFAMDPMTRVTRSGIVWPASTLARLF